MTELYLEYKNEHGEIKRERVGGEKCAVGRHSASDICIPDGRLSRSHLKIDRFGDVIGQLREVGLREVGRPWEVGRFP